MPDLYLVWPGLEWDPWGTRCSTSLPNFEQPQINLLSHGMPSTTDTGGQLLAMSDRILFVGGFASSPPLTDHVISSAFCQSWPTWQKIGSGTFPASASNWIPALVNWGTGALAVWNGIGGDTRLWCSQYNQSQNAWSGQYLTKLAGSNAPIQAGSCPAIVNINGKLLMVWCGEGSNDSLYYATSTDGYIWEGNIPIKGAASTGQPAMVVFNGLPVLCFKGGKNDGGIYSTTFNLNNDSQWASVVATGPFGTSYGPTLAVYQGRLFMAWKGDGSDTDIWWATTSNNLVKSAWSGQSSIPNVGTCAQPAAVVF